MKTILLLDDDREFRGLVVPALEAKGLRVLQARTGAEANAVLGEVDLAVVDGLLPDTDGVSFIARLRAAKSALPVVFVSAFWRDLGTFNKLTKELQVALVLHKPVLPSLFAEEVDALVNGRHGQLALPGPPAREPNPALEEVVRELGAEYRNGLPAKLEHVTAALRALRLEPKHAAHRMEATMLAHRLRGTAGSYGFRAVGEAAGRLEDALVAGPLRPQGWETIDAAAAGLAGAIEALAAAPTEAREESGVSGVSLTSGSLLAVSRSADFLDLMQQVGRQQLYLVACAGSLSEARAAAQRAPPDAAFVDLPVDEAAQVAREIRGVSGCDQVAFAFVSGDDRTPDRIAAAHAGASLFLAKPLDADLVAASARQLVAMAQTHRPRVLVVDDDPAFARHACATLERHGITTRQLAEPARILEVLEEAPPDLILLDVMMAGLSGFDVCRMLRSTPRWQDLPIVMVTSHTGLQARIGAFQSGADDFLSKPVVDEELLSRVQVRVERARLLRERYDKDGLTGLLLRRPLVEGLRARLVEAGRHLRPLAVAIIDFDGFKAVNDTHGHLAGDAVLAAFGKLLARRFRAEDLRGRWGGEEFLLAFPGEQASTMQGALERLHQEFSQVEFRGDLGEPFSVRFCVGIAGFPQDGDSLETLVRAADRRLYLAKRRGGGQVVSVDSE